MKTPRKQRRKITSSLRWKFDDDQPSVSEEDYFKQRALLRNRMARHRDLQDMLPEFDAETERQRQQFKDKLLAKARTLSRPGAVSDRRASVIAAMRAARKKPGSNPKAFAKENPDVLKVYTPLTLAKMWSEAK